MSLASPRENCELASEAHSPSLSPCSLLASPSSAAGPAAAGAGRSAAAERTMDALHTTKPWSPGGLQQYLG